MNKKTITALSSVLAFAMLACSCSQKQEETSAGEETTTSAPTVETTIKTKYNVFSSPDNSYSLIADGYGTPIRNQDVGACFANATATAMESNFMKTYGRQLTINQDQIIYEAYGTQNDEDPDREGMHYRDIPDIKEGKWALMSGTVAANGLVDGCVLTSCWDLTGKPAEEIQEVIRDKGGVVFGISEGKTRTDVHEGYVTLNTDNEICDHMLVVVGWDDGFPSDYFTFPATNNGAWYAQNSFSKYWGNNGFYWISYDSYVSEITSMQVSEEYSHVESYDNGWGETITTGDKTTLANVYECTGTIGAVGTYLVEENSNLHVDIYEGRFGELLYSQDASFKYSGYDTIVLEQPVTVEGEFTVAITYDGPAPVDGETRETGNNAYYLVIADKGQSFVEVDGKWHDMTEKSVKKVLGTDFVPNNACIKVLFKK